METGNSAKKYIGRFAPSPSGNLHFGSLVCALASYLDAKANDGDWLLRVEDLDPPREQPNAKTAILKSLESHGLYWDKEVTYQSRRSALYRDALQALAAENLSYRCDCTRKRLAQLRAHGDNAYDGHCVVSPPAPNALAARRLSVESCARRLGQHKLNFEDRIFGSQTVPFNEEGDFVIHRKDGLFAYHLAVVVDDLAQNISHIVRGADLLRSVGPQAILSRTLRNINHLSHHTFQYAHIPLVLDQHGNKLSKQNKAPPIDETPPRENIYLALRALKIAVPEIASIEDMLNMATKHWQPAKLAGTAHIDAPNF